MNFLFISPNFPTIYSHFIKELREVGFNVLGIGDEPFDQLNDELKNNLTEYCFVSDISRLDWMKDTINYLQWKYGHIDYLESNNEFWLENDAILREYAGIAGLLPQDMQKIKYKSEMKKYFQLAGCKTARYILVSDLETSKKFVSEVGYPVFAKPNNGVGAAETYKINNEEDLVNFHNCKPNEEYIMEEYLDGYITSFDGICDDDSNVVAAVNETFPTPIATVVRENCNVYYYANKNMPASFRKMGEAVVKSFGIKKRCFHIEFFCLNNDKKGLGKKGDIVALEVNMRCPGGHTPDLIALAWQSNYYKIYADVMMNNKSDAFNKDETNIISIAVSRKYHFSYVYSEEEIFNKYGQQIKITGDYPDSFVRAMGKHFYYAVFDSLEEALKFQQFVQKTA